MVTTLQWISDIAPTIDSNNSIEKKNRFITIAKGEVSNTFFTGDIYNLAVAYYTCHLLELSSRDGNSRGIITQEKEGELSRSYGNATTSIVNTTQYLDSYTRLLKSRVPAFYITNGSQN
tara:strand:- start:1399 stop:1755 length:357 start_codon:yes stop_codon:yes gene_type:complete